MMKFFFTIVLLLLSLRQMKAEKIQGGSNDEDINKFLDLLSKKSRSIKILRGSVDKEEISRKNNENMIIPISDDDDDDDDDELEPIDKKQTSSGSYIYPYDPFCEKMYNTTCGKRFCNRKADKRIIGGKNATENEFPWHAAIFDASDKLRDTSRWKYKCGGVLIRYNVVLTSGHCMEKYRIKNKTKCGGKWELVNTTANNCRIAIGLYNLNNINQNQTYSVMGLDFYFEYSYNSTTKLYKYDIALVEINRPKEGTNAIEPACILFDRDISSALSANNCFAIGHGSTDKYSTPDNSKPSPTLQKVKISGFEQSSCIKGLDNNEKKTHYCVFAQDSNSSTQHTVGCYMDSGSPIVCPVHSTDTEDQCSPMFVVGIISNLKNREEDCNVRSTIMMNVVKSNNEENSPLSGYMSALPQICGKCGEK